MNCHFHQTGDCGILNVTGEMGIEYASEFKSSLAEALEQAARIEVDLSGVESVHLCCLQLLCSAHKAAGRSGKILEIRDAGEEFRKGALDAGFIRHAGCLDETGAVCMWLEPDGNCR
jgi:anti-anti-sigma factor